MKIDQAFDYKKVDGSMCTSGSLCEAQLRRLVEEGYEPVINLLPNENEYAVKNEAAIIAAQGMDYAYIPVDFSGPLVSDYQKFSKVLSANADKKIMAHCAANFRVSAFYAIYAVFNLGWTTSQAYEFTDSIWNLKEYPVWDDFVSCMLNVNNV